MSENVDKIYVLGPDGKQAYRVENMDISTPLAFQLLSGVRASPHLAQGESSLAFAFRSLTAQQDTIAKPHNFDYSAVHDVQYGFSP